jgi:hypothetical protein
MDLVVEYEADVDAQPLENGGSNLYVEIDAEDAPAFLRAAMAMDAGDGEQEIPELAEKGAVLVLLTVEGL